MLVALVALLYLAISPIRSLVADFQLSGQRHAQLAALRHQAAALAAQQRALGSPGAPQVQARNLGLVAPGERGYVVYGLPNN
jgi:cell division protein FtsB